MDQRSNLFVIIYLPNTLCKKKALPTTLPCLNRMQAELASRGLITKQLLVLVNKERSNIHVFLCVRW